MTTPTEEERRAFTRAINRHIREFKQDPKTQLAFFVRLGIRTPKGNLTRAWKKYFDYMNSPE